MRDPRFAGGEAEVARGNLFGRPAPATLATLSDRRVTVYRTDRDGAVTVESDGTNFLARVSWHPHVRVQPAPYRGTVALPVEALFPGRRAVYCGPL